ncbi:MAG: hypothetical protein ACYDD1_11310 [Caulobacteraceae bacterium]
MTREDRIAAELVAALRPIFPTTWKRPDRLGFERELKAAVVKMIREERANAAAEAVEALDR